MSPHCVTSILQMRHSWLKIQENLWVPIYQRKNKGYEAHG